MPKQRIGEKSAELVRLYVKENFLIDGTNVKLLRMKLPKNNTSGYKGVYWCKDRGKWRVQITFKRKTYYLGSYILLEDAVNVRKKAEEHLFDEFLNWYNE